jgi:circadian clock protein KaiB
MEENPDLKTSTDAFEKALKTHNKKKYILRLFVSGMTPASLKAIKNLKKICRENLDGQFDLEVIDIYQQPELVKSEEIIAVPTLIKKLPLPLKRFIGDLSDRENVLLGLNIYNKKKDPIDPK